MAASISTVRFFRLSHYLRHPESGRAVLGLSIDESPNDQALGALAAAPPTSASDATGFIVPSDIHEGGEVIVVLRTARVTAVITVTRAVNEGEEHPPIRLSLTLSATGDLTIRHQGLGDAEDDKKERPESFAILDTLLAQLAGNYWSRCKAVTASRQRCPLRQPLNDRDLCPAHRAHLTYLHDVRLEHLKASQRSVSPSASWDENVEAYNELQETIALRNMISELLYPENPDQGHWNAESRERDNRDAAGRTMGRWVLQRREARAAADSATNTAAGTAAMPSFPPAATSSASPTGETTGTDPAVPEDVGRRSLRYYMTENLSIARSRETTPTKMFLWELLVNFEDIKELERRVARNRLMRGSGPGPVSVMEFFDPLDGDRLMGNAEKYVQPDRAYKATEPEVDEFGDIIPPDSPPVVAPVRSPPTPPPAPPPPPTTGREFDDLLDERARSKKDLPPLPGLVEEPPKQEWRWVYGHLDWGSAEMDERTERLYGKW